MFQAVVKELQNLGASSSDALIIANQIDFTQSIAGVPQTAQAIAAFVWQEELEAREALESQAKYEEAQENLINSYPSV